jgi:amino acid permease
MVDYANRFFIILKIVVLILLCYVLNNYIDTKNLLASPIDLGASLLIAIPIFATSFTSHIIVPALSDYLNKNKRDMRNIVIIGSVIPLILYLVWLTTILGVLPLNGEVSFMHTIFDKVPVENANIGNILTALGDKVQTGTTDVVLHVFTYVAIMTSFLSVNLSLLHFNIDSYNLETKFKSKFAVIAIGILLTFTIPVLIIQINPNIFIYAMTYVGVCIAVLLLIIPALISYKIYVNKETFNYKISSIKILWLVSFMSGVLIIACVMI